MQKRRVLSGPTRAAGILMLAFLWLAAFGLSGMAQAAFTITSTGAPTFYTDTSVTPNIVCNYQSFTITSSTAVSDAWVSMGSFSSSLSLGGGDPGKFHLGSFTAGQTRAAFFYVCSSFTGTTQASQGYTLTLYDRDPALSGAASLGSSSFTFGIDNTLIQANPNQVTVIFSGPNPGELGGIITMTVQGTTGTIGCVNPPSPCTGAQAGPLAFSPAAFANWRADAYQLVGSNINLSGGNSLSVDNTLYISNLPSSSTTNYTATYYFRAMTTTSTTTTLSPIGDIASGTQMKHTSLNSGAYSGAGLLPIQPASNTMTLSKSANTSMLPAQGGRVTYSVVLSNSGSAAATLDSLQDTLPSGATYVAGSSSYGGVSIADPLVSGSTRIWSNSFTIPAQGTATLIYQLDLPATPGTYTNSVIGYVGSTVIDTTLSISDNVPATATTVVLKAPTISKSFSPSALVVNGTSQLTLTLSNPNSSQTLSGIQISDSYPAGLSNSGTPTTTCGVTPTSTSSSIAISGLTLAAGASCTVTVNVTSSSAATYTNTTGTISSSNGGTGTTASASITFTTLPSITKSFGSATIPAGGTTTLTLTVTNNASVGISSIGLTDLFPSGMVLAASPGLTPASPCSGTLQSWNGTTASALTGGAPGVSLSGGALATPGGSCTFSVNVTAASAGTYNNTTSGATSSLGSTGPVSNTATLVVMSPPTVAKAFSPSTIGKGQNSQLTITLGNSNSVAITSAAFTDTYPTNLVNASSPAGSTTCSGGAVTASSGGGSVALSGATIPAGGSCTVTVTVTSNVVNNPGYVNTIAAGGVTASNTGSNAAAASATLIVNATPTMTKSYTVDPTGGTTTLNLTITNNHTAGISGLSFSDTFPSGMSVDSTPTLTNSCGGTVTGATSGSALISLSGGTIAGASPASCTITLRVKLASGGVYNNQTTGVALTAPFTGTGSVSNIATLIAPIIIKSFTPNTVGPNGISVMQIQITNPSISTGLTSLALSDSYPAGSTNTSTFMKNTASPGLSNTCGGTANATAGASALTLTGGSLSAGQSCTMTVNVQANPSSPDTYYNTTGTVRSAQGIGGTGADSLYIVNMPTITKSFLTSPVTLTAGIATSVMRIVVKSNATVSLAGVSLSDTFPITPSQMRYVNTVSNGCGGTLTDQAGAALVTTVSTGFKLGGVTLAAGASCTLDVTISVSAAGTYNNQTSGATSTTSGFTSPGPVSNVASLVANLSVPTVSKSFSAAQVGVSSPVTMTITLTNTNTTAITGASFTDTYPGTMVNYSAPALTNSCGGSATATAGDTKTVLAAGTVPALGSCSITVAVTATSPGALTNSTGSITTGNAGTATAATGSVTFFSPPTLTKSFSASTYGIGAQGTMTLTLTNPAGNAGTLTNVQVADNLALSGLAIASTTVTLTPAACGTVTKNPSGVLAIGDTNILLTAATLAVGASCQAVITVSNSLTGSLTNTTGTPSGVTTGLVTITGSVASASFTVVQAALTKAWSVASITSGGTSNLVFTLTNGSGNPAQTGIAFSDSLPGSLKLNSATPTVTYGSGCAGTSTPTIGTPDLIGLSSVSMAASTASCTITVTAVTNRSGLLNASCAANPSAFTNGSSNISGLTHLTNSVTNQCLVVTGSPSLTVSKTEMIFSDPIHSTTNPKAIPGAVAAYTITVINSGPGAVDNNTVVVGDAIPANTEMYVSDIGTAGSGPVVFTNGSTSSGLTYTYTSLASTTDNLEFSKDNGGTWTYTPTPDASGFDALVTNIRVRPQGSMAAAGASNPSFTITFRIKVN
jgi:uncharacterized repeat protein (TIGR01451 family)